MAMVTARLSCHLTKETPQTHKLPQKLDLQGVTQVSQKLSLSFSSFLAPPVS